MAREAGPSIVPPCKFSYPENGRILTGGDKQQLIDAITNDRIANNRPVGDPENDFRLYVEKNFPDHAGAVTMDRAPIEPEVASAKLRERVTVWLANRYSLRPTGGAELVSQEEAVRRSSICASCPQNKAYENDCAPCVASLQRTAFLLRQGHSTNRGLSACAITGQDNETAAFLPEPMLAHRHKYSGELKDAAPHCWLLNL